MISVNKKIIDYIRENKISQSDVAKKAGIAQSNLNRLLNSDDLRVSHLIQITKALDLPVSYFFDGTEHISNTEIENYKKKIEDLEYLISLGRKHEEEKLYIILTSILDSEFKGLKKETKNVLLKEWDKSINEMKKIRERVQFNVSEVSRDEIIESIKERIKQIEQKKP